MSLEELLRDNKYPDLLLNYECLDQSGTMECHRVVLATLSYFDVLLRNTVLERASSSNLLFSLRIQPPVKYQTFEHLMNQLYHRSFSGESSGESYIKQESDLTDLIQGYYFFGFPRDRIHEALLKLFHRIHKSATPYPLIQEVLSLSCLSQKMREAFLARFLYRLSKEERGIVQTNYPELSIKQWFQGASSHNETQICLLGGETYVANGLEFTTYDTHRNYDEGDHSGFWLESAPVEISHLDGSFRRIKVPLNQYGRRFGFEEIFYGQATVYIYTGLQIRKYLLRRNTFRCYDYSGEVVKSTKDNNLAFPNWFNSSYGDERERYGHIFEYQRFPKSTVFEIVITLEKNEP